MPLIRPEMPPHFGTREIQAILPHRYPFLLVDKILEHDMDVPYIIGQKNVTVNEDFFNGHFPGVPIMPGVLILESVAQTGGIMIHMLGYRDKIAVLLNVNNVKFRRPTKPGDVLTLHCEGKHFSAKGGRIAARATVDGQLVAQGEVGFALVDKEQI